MRAWHVESLGAPTDVMRHVDTADLRPGTGQVTVRVASCTLGFPDVLMCRAGYQHQPDLPFSPGAEIYGEILEAGPGVDLASRGLALGSKVLALGVGLHGGLADIALVIADLLFAAPEGLDVAESSALLGAYLTGWLALTRAARLQADEVLLVHAAAGGVGSAAVQLGLAAGATVIGVTRGERKAAVVRELGAHVVIDRERESVIDVVKSFTDGRGADVAYDPVGGPSWFESTKCVAFEGRLVLIGFAGGEILSQPLNHPLVKNYSIIGVNSGLYTARRPDIVQRAMAELRGLAERGEIRPLIGERVPFSDAPRALQDIDDGVTVGRMVVMVGGAGA
jgi:NADPH2:quinone reductase